MQTKQILFTAPGVAELVDVQSPALGAHDVRVRMAYTAVSAGTERANLVGEMNIAGSLYLDKVVFPRALGYSGTGVIEEIGSDVTSVKVGDRVVVVFGKHMYDCVLNEHSVIPIRDDSVSMLEAAFIVIANFPLEGIRKARMEIGESALIAGLGILGLFAVQFARLGGAMPVIASDLRPERRELAKAMGADVVLDPRMPHYAETVKELTGGKGANVVIEVTGVDKALGESLACAAQFARVALLGCTRNPDAQLDFYHLVHSKGVSLIGANTCARPKVESQPFNWTQIDDCTALVHFLAAKRFQVQPLISEVHAPSDAPEVYRRLAYEAFPIGVAFDWSK